MASNVGSSHFPPKFHFNKIYPGNRKFLWKYVLSGNLKIYVIFGAPLQASHFSYTDVVYKSCRRDLQEKHLHETFPQIHHADEKRPKSELLGHIFPPPPQGLLTWFPILNCNIKCYQQLSNVSDHHPKM